MTEPMPPRWHWWLLVAEAGARLAAARMLVAAIPLHRWSGWLGQAGGSPAQPAKADASARMLARAVRRGADRLPLDFKCLPRAVALHTMLRRRKLPSRLVIAAADPQVRGRADDLHAWVELGGEILIGETDQPFHPVVRYG